ncbi:MAG: sigma-54-dependent Fis family transcriptional regulator [Polyangiaceae bacterium]|nr:sigma-54-dependent Fis family transcriptional regulator [Polyangiaceae bacterium]
MTNQSVLLVDDDGAFRRVYARLLTEAGHAVIEAHDRATARAAMAEYSIPVAIVDLMLPPDGSIDKGLSELPVLLATQPATKVIVVSGAGDVPHMLRAVRSGAYDFLTKPVDPDVLLVVVERALARYAIERQVETLLDSLRASQPAGAMIGQSPAFLEALRTAEQVAPTDLPVLITGETGTGKELMARAVHAMSQRRDCPFLAVNCGALPESILSSTLFGHVKGAFTGALRDRKGLFAEADGGTVFLDEIGDMAPGVQVALLRALEQGEIVPVGADRPVVVNVRVVSATHKDLGEMVASRSMREDLYWRVRGVELLLPALRDRAADLPLLAAFFLQQCASLSRDGRARSLSAAAQDALLEHSWPGNLRELRYEMQRATVLTGERLEIEPDQLAFVTARRARSVRPRSNDSAEAGSTLRERVEALERSEIAAALETSCGNRTRAAEALGLSRQGLLQKMQRYGIESA